jgi:translation initiation factor 4B
LCRRQISKLTVYFEGYHSVRDNLPQQLPDKPPFTAHLGNLSYDATTETVTEFFSDCHVVSVRIIKDRDNQPKGFAYAEFETLEDLKTALTRDGQTFQGRSIRIKVADPRT